MKPDAKRTFEIVGTLSVVASLLFVGLQLYLDRQIAAAEQYQYRAESRKADLRSQLESDAYISRRAQTWKAGSRPSWWNDEIDSITKSQELTESNIVTIILEAHIGLVHFDNIYYQYNQGLIDDEFWQSALVVIEGLLTNDPIAREVWLSDVLRPISKLAPEIIMKSN